MKAIESIRRSAVAVRPDDTVATAAAVMERAGVGALAVIDGDEVVGVVTDRDLVRRVLARSAPADGRIDGAMSSPVVSIQADADLHDAFGILRANAVRRIVVLDGRRFVGMISVDDLLVELAADLHDLSHPMASELLAPHRESAPMMTTGRTG
jgi:CBS domain-containing protein